MKALVVDDDLALADVVSFTLRRAGYEVIVAHDGQMALDRWQAEQPDFIVLDLNLPRLSGLEVCQRIRAEADTPILILSVRDEDDDVVNGLKAGADDYIVKPFSPRQLVARVDTVLRRAGASRASRAAPDKFQRRCAAAGCRARRNFRRGRTAGAPDSAGKPIAADAHA